MSRSALNDDALWEVAEACGACGSGERRVLFAVRGRRFAECAGCGVVRLLDRVRPECLDVLYGSYYAPGDLSGEALEAQLRNPTFAHRRRRLEGALPAGRRRLFEVGAGDGNFLALLARNGWSVAGSEWGAASVDLVRRRHGIALLQGDVVGADLPAGAFDAVAAYHVLEHVYQPRAWLLGVRRLVAPGGVLHLQVPNFGALLRRLSGRLSPTLVFPEHVYLYSPATLAGLLRREGFEVVSLTTYDPWHGPGTVEATVANVAQRLLTGRGPWDDVRAPEAPAGGEASAPAGTEGTASIRGGAGRGFSRAGRALLRPVARAVARAEGWAGVGAVVDVVARPVG